MEHNLYPAPEHSSTVPGLWVGLAGLSEDLGLGLTISVLSMDGVCRTNPERFHLGPLPSVWLMSVLQATPEVSIVMGN